jgi:hypothetical protein
MYQSSPNSTKYGCSRRSQKLQSAGANAVGAVATGAAGIQGLSNLAPGKAPTTPTVTPKVPEGKPLTSFGSVGENREMAKNKTMFEKLKVFFTKLGEKPKLMSIFKSKLAVRVGEAGMARLTALGVSLAAAPMSAGVSLIVSLAFTVWSIYDLYQLYELVFGDGGLYDEVMKDEKTDSVGTDKALLAAAVTPNITPAKYNPAADSQAANTSPKPGTSTPSAPPKTPTASPPNPGCPGSRWCTPCPAPPGWGGRRGGPPPQASPTPRPPPASTRTPLRSSASLARY